MNTKIAELLLTASVYFKLTNPGMSFEKKWEITEIQYLILELATHEDKPTFGEVGNFLSCSPATISTFLTDLAKRRLIQKIVHPIKRGRSYSLTIIGKNKLEEIRNDYLESLREFIRGIDLSEQESEVLVSILGRVNCSIKP